jgi:DNA-binding transcriptional ArsR family regulator
LVKAGGPGLPVGKLQSRLGVPASTLSHHLKTLLIVGLITQDRDATTLYCKANYTVMRGLVGFLVDKCCTEADCASIRQQADTSA